MTPEQQQIAIAEGLGLKIELRAEPSGSGYWVVLGPDGKLVPAPDYLNDLNAMAEAENTLKSHDMERYANKLAIVVGNALRDEYRQFYVLHATATQRAEAFLRTIWKWKA